MYLYLHLPWMLDTNICIYLIRQKSVSVLEKFEDMAQGQVILSVITLAELEYGARKSAVVEKNLAALHQFLILFGGLPLGKIKFSAKREKGRRFIAEAHLFDMP